MTDAASMRARAVRIADDVLFPAALDVDRADRIPAAHLDLLAAEGFYGIAAPPEHGGFGVEDFATVASVLAAFAGGCLATAFVWLQHLGPLIAASFSDRPGLAGRWVGPLARGERRGGIALAALRGRDPLRVRPVDGGYRLDGTVPWVSGWDMIDTVQVGARDGDDAVFLMVDAVAGPTLRAEVIDVVATQASRTATLTFDGHPVPADRLLGTRPIEEWSRGEASGSVLNGFLALGVVERCGRLLRDAGGDGPATALEAETVRCREALFTAADAEGDAAVAVAADARAAAAELVLRASALLVTQVGSRAVRLDQHAQRLAREAVFLQVFGSRPAIRDALLTRLTP